jgi:hypothetical protein
LESRRLTATEKETDVTTHKNNVWANLIIAGTLAAAIIMIATVLMSRSARADGMRGPPGPPPQAQNGNPGLYPQPVPLQRPGRSCLMTALQLGYQTGRNELAYAGMEACAIFAGSRGFGLPYGYYGPYVPPGWVPPGWVYPIGPAY